jgi:hypothetical protein
MSGQVSPGGAAVGGARPQARRRGGSPAADAWSGTRPLARDGAERLTLPVDADDVAWPSQCERLARLNQCVA